MVDKKTKSFSKKGLTKASPVVKIMGRIEAAGRRWRRQDGPKK
jgi:hypothetical protein